MWQMLLNDRFVAAAVLAGVLIFSSSPASASCDRWDEGATTKRLAPVYEISFRGDCTTTTKDYRCSYPNRDATEGREWVSDVGFAPNGDVFQPGFVKFRCLTEGEPAGC